MPLAGWGPSAKSPSGPVGAQLTSQALLLLWQHLRLVCFSTVLPSPRGGKTVTLSSALARSQFPLLARHCFWQRVWGMGRPRPRTEETLPALPLGCALSCLPWLSVLLAEVCPYGEPSSSSYCISYRCTIPPTAVGRAGHQPRTSAPGMQLRLGPGCPTLLRPGLSSPKMPKLVKKPKRSSGTNSPFS